MCLYLGHNLKCIPYCESWKKYFFENHCPTVFCRVKGNITKACPKYITYSRNSERYVNYEFRDNYTSLEGFWKHCDLSHYFF